jgi:hypothetical protein
MEMHLTLYAHQAKMEEQLGVLKPQVLQLHATQAVFLLT